MVANEKIKNGLKYDVPNILELKHAQISEEQKDFFREYLDEDKMTHDVMEFWLSQDDETNET